MKYNFSHTYRLKSYINCIVISFFSLLLINCIETFEPTTLTFEETLVIEAIITDEFKSQEIILSMTTPLENKELEPETNAEIIITDNASNSYRFEESSPGNYISTVPFNAEFGNDYSLLVTTANGESYVSEIVTLAGTAQIDEVNAIRTVNGNGSDGVEINVDGSEVSGEASFFRYEYEETYKLVSPFTFNLDMVIVSENPPELGTITKTIEERICFNSDASNSILIFNSNSLSDNRIVNFPIRFITSDNPIIRTRYSILVKQFVHSRQGFSFYETLSEISDLENLFAQVQPGFVEGNIRSVTNPNINVLGIFEVASVDEKRIFFNYREIFPDTLIPSYFDVSCTEDTIATFSVFPSENQLIRARNLLNRGFKLAGVVPGFSEESTMFLIFPPACVDCNILGTNIQPDFWVE